MLEIKNVSKIYMIGNKVENSFAALKRVSLTIHDGEMLAIMGKSGAGKSTLLHILGCLDNFEEGDYLVDGKSVKKLSDRHLAQLRNKKFGFVMQDFSLINHRTALYNVEAPMLFGETPFFEMKKRALNALTSAGVADQAKKEIVNMSGGQRQRVAIARAVVNDPDIILADEPTGNLDEATTGEIMELLCDLNRRGKTVVIITHDQTVADYCTRKITLSDGRIISDSSYEGGC